MPLPLKARVAVRDRWDDKESEVQKALHSLQETVGWSVRCTPDFAVLWEGLNSVYDDAADFVTAVTSLIRIWCQELDNLLSDATNEEWAEKLLEIIGESGVHVITLLVEIGKPNIASTSWNASSSTFTLALPSTRVTFAPGHASELRAEIVGIAEKKEAKAAAADDWADLGDPKVSTLPVHTLGTVSAPPTAAAVITFLPTLNDVPRPDVLQLQAPYRLILHDLGNHLEVQCSHSPSLELLAGYLQKWCRASAGRSDRTPVMDVRLNTSAFGLGVIYDALTIKPKDTRDPMLLPPVLVLNLVENVLGYRLVQEYASSWRFIREQPLKAGQ